MVEKYCFFGALIMDALIYFIPFAIMIFIFVLRYEQKKIVARKFKPYKNHKNFVKLEL